MRAINRDDILSPAKQKFLPSLPRGSGGVPYVSFSQKPLDYKAQVRVEEGAALLSNRIKLKGVVSPIAGDHESQHTMSQNTLNQMRSGYLDKLGRPTDKSIYQ